MRLVFGSDGLTSYPLDQFDPDELKLTPLEKIRLVPPGSDQQLLDYLSYLYDNERESMTEDDINLYFWLLCYIDGDCRGPDPIKYEWHHIIPKQRESHPLVAAAKNCSDPFLFNKENNLISLEKYVKETGAGRHGNHPQYNEWVLEILNQLLANYRNRFGNGAIDPCLAKELLIELIEETLKPAINENPSESINELGKRKLN